jgi:hypothetical protein
LKGVESRDCLRWEDGRRGRKGRGLHDDDDDDDDVLLWEEAYTLIK